MGTVLFFHQLDSDQPVGDYVDCLWKDAIGTQKNCVCSVIRTLDSSGQASLFACSYQVMHSKQLKSSSGRDSKADSPVVQ